MCRHPEASKRPKFADILVVLQQPDFMLLQWDPEEAVDERARTLGSQLDDTVELYKALRDTYLVQVENSSQLAE